jgi:tetratricopeptide (TPR) repeat protein
MELRYEKTNTWNSMVLALERDNATAAEGFKKQFLAEQPYTERGSRPTLRYLHRFRGYLDLKMGRMAEAIEEFKEALRHRPLLWNIDSFEDCLARAYLEVGQLDEAVAEYQRIVRLNPNYPLAHYHLAQAFERKGDHDRARTSYERFLQIWREADADLPQVVAARNYLALPS